MFRSLPAAMAIVLLSSAVAGAQNPSLPGTVTLSRTEYDRLIDLANARPRGPEGPPVAAALSRADIRVRVSGGTARATMQVEGEVFRAGQVKVPMVSGATLLEARTTDRRTLPLVAEGDSLMAVVSGPGSFAATLEWGAPVTMTPGRGSIVLPVPPAGSVTATIDVPGEQTDVRVSPGLIVRRTGAGGRALVDVTLTPGSPVQVSWSARETAPAPIVRDARLLSEVKTLVTIGEADVRLVALLDLTVVQGEPREIEVRVPSGWEVTSVTGGTLDRSEERAGAVALFLADPSVRRHQFLLGLERPHPGGSFKLETAFPSVSAAQRETGEIGIEGVGALELSASDGKGLRRTDVREVDRALASLTRQPLLAAFRYQRGPDGPPGLALDVKRFPDAAVLAAIAERAVATTLVTSEGRALTEISLWIRNRAQPFAKVALPPDASILSVEVAGAPAKPAEASDGTRVPLLRPGFRPTGPYAVSFVYVHSGAPFTKKGELQMTLPKMDLPVDVVEWEVFVPDRYKVERTAGNAIEAWMVERSDRERLDAIGTTGAAGGGSRTNVPLSATAGQIVGRLTDNGGGVIPGARVVVEAGRRQQVATSDANGVFVVSGVPSGPVTVTTALAGFVSAKRSLIFDQRPRQVDFTLVVGGIEETVTVNAEAPVIDTRSSEYSQTARPDQARVSQTRGQQVQQAGEAASANVLSLQRRASGVLPVRIEVPRAGTSYRFLKPLVIDEETMVRLKYKRR